MSERRQILILVAITVIIAIAGTQLGTIFGGAEGEAVVTQYTAVFHADGRLEETFTYKINAEGKRFLFRYWEAPLSVLELDYPHIELLDIEVPSGTYWYLMDYSGKLYTSDTIDSSSVGAIRSLAYWNEAGAFNPNGYEPGEYTVRILYQVRPPIEYDSEYSHLNLKLASEHITYQNVRVEIENPGYIEELYPHPPNLRESTDRNLLVYTGRSGEDELLEFEFLMTLDALEQLDGFPRQEENIKTQTINANNRYNFEYQVANSFLWVNQIATFLLPVGLYLYWQRVGKEKEYVVPQFLSVIPNKLRKPWIVNLVFKRDATDFDKDGFHATLLDLHEKGKIDVSYEKEDLVVEIVDEKGLDRYEYQVLHFLKGIARDNIIRTEYMTDMVQRAQKDSWVEQQVLSLKSQYDRLVSGTSNEVASEYTTNGRMKLVPLMMISMLLTFGPIVSLIFYDNATSIFLSAAGYGAITFIQLVIAIIFPTTLFGYWKEDIYREKLEWDAFSHHLSDFSRLQQYGPEDMNMWGQWLVYGTALGVGDKVAEAMETLKVDYPAMYLVPTYAYWFLPIYTARTPSMSRSSGGGGFGGGGGGVR